MGVWPGMASVGGLVCVFFTLPVLANYGRGGDTKTVKKVPAPRVDMTGPVVGGMALAGSCPNCLAARGAMGLITEIGKALRSASCATKKQIGRKRLLFIVRPALCGSGIRRTRTTLGATRTRLRCTHDGCDHVGRTIGDSTIDRVRMLRTRSSITRNITTIGGTRTTLDATRAGLDCYCIHTPFSKAVDGTAISMNDCINNSLRPIALTAVCGSGRVCTCFGMTSGR